MEQLLLISIYIKFKSIFINIFSSFSTFIEFLLILIKLNNKIYDYLLIKFFKNSKLVFLLTKDYINLVVAVFVLYTIVTFIHNNIIFFKFFYKYVILLSIIYLLVSMFLFLSKHIGFGKYTSQLQRFWKRSYILFWGLEFFLFFLYIYLLTVHFSESTYFLDLRPLILQLPDLSNYFIINCFLILLIIWLNYSLIFFFKTEITPQIRLTRIN